MTTWVKRLWVELKTDGLRNTISAQTFHSEEKGGEKKNSKTSKTTQTERLVNLPLNSRDMMSAELMFVWRASVPSEPTCWLWVFPVGIRPLEPLTFVPGEILQPASEGRLWRKGKAEASFFLKKLPLTLLTVHTIRGGGRPCVWHLKKRACLPSWGTLKEKINGSLNNPQRRMNGRHRQQLVGLR